MLRLRGVLSSCSKNIQRNSCTDFKIYLNGETGLSTVHWYFTQFCLRAAVNI